MAKVPTRLRLCSPRLLAKAVMSNKAFRVRPQGRGACVPGWACARAAVPVLPMHACTRRTTASSPTGALIPTARPLASTHPFILISRPSSKLLRRGGSQASRTSIKNHEYSTTTHSQTPLSVETGVQEEGKKHDYASVKKQGVQQQEGQQGLQQAGLQQADGNKDD